MNKIDKIFRKSHYAIGLILFALASACMYDVFYMKNPVNFEQEPFRYFAPSIFMPFLLGIIQTAVLSLGKEKRLFPIQCKDTLGNVIFGLFDVMGLCLLNMAFIYISNIISEKNFYIRRSAMSGLHLTFAILQLLLATASLIFSEYITIINKDEKAIIPKKQLVIQGILYGSTLTLYFFCLFINYKIY